MAIAVETETKARGRALAMVGGITTIIAIIAAAIPLGYTLYALATGAVTLTTLDDVQNLATNGTIATIVAIAIGLISLIICIIAVVLAVRVMRIVAGAVSLLVLIAAVLFGVLYVQPHVNDLNTLNNTIQPFAQSIQDNCGTPLNATNNDLLDALIGTQSAADDPSFAAVMGRQVPKLQADAINLNSASAQLAKLKVPDPKYQQLYNDCVSSVKAEQAFLTNSSAIPLPAPFSTIMPSVSGIDLLQDSAALATGQVPGIKLPPGTVEPLVEQVLTQVVFAKSNLTAEGQALRDDIRTRLTNDCAPFKVDAADIVS